MFRFLCSVAILAAAQALDDGCSGVRTADGLAQKHEMTGAARTKGAVCLDGSPGVYYLQKGSGDGVNKWYVHHEGGGWCESVEDCYARSKTVLGSTTSSPSNASLGGGYFDTNAATNPLMYNWNHVFMLYCDGASFSGNNETVERYNGTALYWRGKRIREAIASDLMEKQGMNEASDLIVSGCSAGGLATYLHTDQWCDMLKAANPSAKCAGLPDSGFFLDYQDAAVKCSPIISYSEERLGNTVNGDYHCGLKWAYTIQNASAGVNQVCTTAHEGEEWKCMFAEHAAQHIHSPMFAMQSAYDSWQTGHVQGPDASVAKTQTLGNNITARIQSMLMANNNESGAFLDSCHHHCGAWNSIKIDGDLVSAAIQKWYNGIGTVGNKRLWNQNKAYPCEACCKPVEVADTVVV